MWKSSAQNLGGLRPTEITGERAYVFLRETSTELRQSNLRSTRDKSLGETYEEHCGCSTETSITEGVTELLS